MAFRKFQSVEKSEILPQGQQEKISSELHKLGKTSVRDLTDEERRKALDATKRV